MPKREEFIAIFKAEAEEYVTKLDRGLVELEKDHGLLELAKELNLVVHTLKGSARVFGFTQIQDIAHLIEGILDGVSQKKLEFSPFIAQKIFKGLDSIRGILEKVLKDSDVKIDISEVCGALQGCLMPEAGDEGDKIEAGGEPGLSVEKPQEAGNAVNARQGADDEEYIRVPLSRVNKILNLSGEIVINKMKTSDKVSHAKRLAFLAKKAQKEFASLAEAFKGELCPGDEKSAKLLAEFSADMHRLKEDSLILWENISKEAFYLDPVIDTLQASMKEMRMLPLSSIFEGFPRMVRDIARESGKAINLEVTGSEIELDKKVLEGIKGPLIHILRNCIDHGIEEPDERVRRGKPGSGNIKLSAFHQAGNVVIRVEDDGQGLDAGQIKYTAVKKNFVSEAEAGRMSEKEILNLVFMNGYSTSPMITDISGRGIGLDIVRRGIENLKGEIILETEKGKGTSFSLVLPLTIAIIEVLLLKERDTLFALPLSSITENIKVKREDISTIDSKMAIDLRGHTVALVMLDDVLGLAPSSIDAANKRQPEEELNVVIVSTLDKKVGFIVDKIIGEEEVFIKSLGRHLGKLKNISGAIILWTGDVVVILDVEDLLVNSRLAHPAVMDTRHRSAKKQKDKRILLVEDAISTRELEKNIVESEGYLVDTAVDGLDGLERLAKTRYDLIISDIQMPRMDGFQLCERVRKNDAYKDIPVIIVTALSNEEDRRRGIQVGASAYIIKTAFDQSVLLRTIERLIG